MSWRYGIDYLSVDIFEIVSSAASGSTNATHDCGASCAIKEGAVRTPATSAAVDDVH